MNRIALVQTQSKAAAWLAVAEVFAVYSVGAVLGLLLAKLCGVSLSNPLAAIAEHPQQDLIPIAFDLAQLLFWQYLGWFLCIGLMRLLRGPLPETRDTRPRPHWRGLLGLGLAAGCVAALPARLLFVVNDWLHLGDTAPWRAALLDAPWDFDFWVLMAVGSFALIPFVEEMFYRGYVLKRLNASMRTGSALMLGAALFAFSHAQYLHFDALNLITLASVVFSGLVYGVVVVYARSLWPAILAHAMINVPASTAMNLVIALTMAVYLVITWTQWRPLRDYSRTTFAGERIGHLLAMALVGGALAFAFHATQELALLAGALLTLMMLGGYRWYLRRLIRQGDHHDVAVHA